MAKRKSKKDPQKSGKGEQPTKAPRKEAEDASPQRRITTMDPAGPFFSGTNSR